MKRRLQVLVGTWKEVEDSSWWRIAWLPACGVAIGIAAGDVLIGVVTTAVFTLPVLVVAAVRLRRQSRGAKPTRRA
jgi:hypothetical protein